MSRYPKVAAVGLVALAALLAGCSSTVSGTPAGGPSATGSPSVGSFPSSSSGATPSASSSASSVPTPSAGSTPASVLQGIALRSSDLSAGYTMSLVQGGDEVTDQVTLDNCGYDFTTETHRSVRRQYAMYDSNGDDTGASNELVAYDSSASAAKAVAQWYASAAQCPRTPVKSKIAGVPDLRMVVSRHTAALTTLPVRDNVLTVESGTGDGHTFYNVTILQARGRYLDAVYVNQDTKPTTDDIDAAGTLAIITGRRLAAVH